MKQRKTRWTQWIVGAAVVLWGTTLATAGLGIEIRWYLAVWLATLVASLGVAVCAVDDMIGKHQSATATLGRSLVREGVSEVQAAIALHASRMEQATTGHGDKMAKNVFAADRWYINGHRGEVLAQLDAAEAVRRSQEDSGPINFARGRG